MKKLILVSTLFCAISYAGYTAYNYATMTEMESQIMENIEALTQNEGTAVGDCHTNASSRPKDNKEWIYVCDWSTSGSMIYPCPTHTIFGLKGESHKCTK